MSEMVEVLAGTSLFLLAFSLLIFDIPATPYRWCLLLCSARSGEAPVGRFARRR